MKVSGNYQGCLKILAAIVMLSCVPWTNCVSAQDDGLFSGAGIRAMGMQTPETNEAPAKKRWPPNLFTTNRADETTRKPLVWPTPKLGLFNKDNEMEYGMSFDDKARPSMFGSMPKLFPPRDLDRPPFFQDFNERTKAFFSRPANDFSGWAAQQNERAKSRSFETWDSITRGLKRPFNSSPETQQMTRPPIRSAQRFDEQPGVRF